MTGAAQEKGQQAQTKASETMQAAKEKAGEVCILSVMLLLLY